ncbi:hypothetical protein [Klebsiella pneumoniae]|nr:hypothetical protein [Klebsiella pneumoniae]
MLLTMNDLSICAFKIKAPPKKAAHHQNGIFLLSKLAE